MKHTLAQQQQRLAVNSARLDGVSPLAVLSRGYSIAKQGDKVIKSINEVDSTQPLVTQLGDGEIVSRVDGLK